MKCAPLSSCARPPRVRKRSGLLALLLLGLVVEANSQVSGVPGVEWQ